MFLRLYKKDLRVILLSLIFLLSGMLVYLFADYNGDGWYRLSKVTVR